MPALLQRAGNVPRVDRRISLERGAALDALVPQWEELAAQAVEPNPFYEHWMLRPALAYLGGSEVDLLCVRRGGTLEVLVPVLRVPRYKGFPVRAFSSWRHKHCLLGTPLVRSGCAPEALAALLDWMREQRAASVLEMRYLIAFHERAELQWMDSFTAPGNGTLARLWKDRCVVQHLAVGVGAAGELALAALPILQWMKRLPSRLKLPGLDLSLTLPGRRQRAT